MRLVGCIGTIYCVTGDEPSPEVLTRLLESNRKSIRIPLPQGADDPLHAALAIVRQLALQGDPVAINLLLLRKSFLIAGPNYPPVPVNEGTFVTCGLKFLRN